MDKGLKALEELSDLAICGDLKFQERHNVFRRSAGVEKYKPIIEKELKALEIIRGKQVDTLWFIDSDNKSLSAYNAMMLDLMGAKRYKELTQEEFDLLKGVLG